MNVRQVALAAALLLSSLLIQSVVLSRLPLPGATPDLLLLVVIALAISWGPVAGSIIGFAAGLSWDLISPADGPMGAWALLYILVGWVAGRMRRPGERAVWELLVVSAGLVAAVTVGYWLLLLLVGDDRADVSVLLRTVPSAVVYAVILAPFVVPGVTALARRAAAYDSPARL